MSDEPKGFHSRDELLMRTVGLMETLPERISSLETSVQKLLADFARHQGEQDQGVKRTVDRVEMVEKSNEIMKKEFEECRKGKVGKDLCDEVNQLKKNIEEINNDLQPIIDDYDSRQETKKTIGGYVKELITSFIRYASLPLTIIILVVIFGMDPSYIPWYNKPHETTINQTQTCSGEFWSRVHNNTIAEHDIHFIINRYRNSVIVSRVKDLSGAEEDYRYQVMTSGMYSTEHLFVWIPSSQDGIARIYDRSGRTIGSDIRIKRGN